MSYVRRSDVDWDNIRAMEACGDEYADYREEFGETYRINKGRAEDWEQDCRNYVKKNCFGIASSNDCRAGVDQNWDRFEIVYRHPSELLTQDCDSLPELPEAKQPPSAPPYPDECGDKDKYCEDMEALNRKRHPEIYCYGVGFRDNSAANIGYGAVGGAAAFAFLLSLLCGVYFGYRMWKACRRGSDIESSRGNSRVILEDLPEQLNRKEVNYKGKIKKVTVLQADPDHEKHARELIEQDNKEQADKEKRKASEKKSRKDKKRRRNSSSEAETTESETDTTESGSEYSVFQSRSSFHGSFFSSYNSSSELDTDEEASQKSLEEVSRALGKV